MDKLIEAKIDKIAEDTAYMRGKWDATIPNLQASIINHETRLGGIENKFANLQGRMTVSGIAGGGIMTLLVFWVKKLLNL